MRVHNLKNIDVDIPRGALVAVCGVSGSGKTSLAIDTLYAEGQRRYIESFSAYTRQFLERLDKPDFDHIEGLTPALAVTRSGSVRGNRSTVGTASESLDYLRLLFAKAASLVCYGCGRTIQPANSTSVAGWLSQLVNPFRLMIAAPVLWDDVGQRAEVLAELQQQGLVRLIAGGRTIHLSNDSRSEMVDLLPSAGKAWVVVDRLSGPFAESRCVESLETAFAVGQLATGRGEASLLIQDTPENISRTAEAVGIRKPNRETIDQTDWIRIDLSQRLFCPDCQIEYPDAQPQLFSFNSPLGACPRCEGFGDTIDWDQTLIVPDRTKSIADGAIAPWNMPSMSDFRRDAIEQLRKAKIPLDVPVGQLTDAEWKVVYEGDKQLKYPGILGMFAWLERKKYKMHVRVFLSRWRSYNRCGQCQGARLKPESLAYRLGGHNFAELCAMQIDQLDELLASPRQLSPSQAQMIQLPLKQLRARLGYLRQVGLGYLSLDRTLRTLSGGEAQRTALTAALGSSLVNMLYVLDEPSVGLHPHDVQRLATSIKQLSGRGNTVVMIEHEEALLDQADWIVEVGPGAGYEGGRITYCGPRNRLEQSDSLTGSYLSGRRIVPVAEQLRQPSGFLKLTGCRGNNLKNVDVEFPLGVLCLVAGVSGSGKSTLIQDTLYPAIANRLTSSRLPALPFDNLLGLGLLDDCLLLDQSPISRSPRSNPVTTVKAMDEIRKVFADTTDSKVRGFAAGHFSFNSPLGRCPRCEGDGVLQIDMQFLADVVMPCPECHGSRYRPEILQVRYRDQSVAEVLQMTVHQAQNFFRGQSKVQQKLKILTSVGLDYLQLGQSATTLSTGEGQRLKLAAFLAAATERRTLFILDEPTTGLHTHDILQLQDCFDALLAAGHSLIVVEHNLHLLAAADHIIDIGPGPSELGGQVVASGTPAELIGNPNSITGRYLAAHIRRQQAAVE